jgi:hypothetical protein
MDNYPATLRHRDAYNRLPIHIECKKQCRTAVLAKRIDLYPESLGEVATSEYHQPLHWLLCNEASSVYSALLMME